MRFFDSVPGGVEVARALRHLSLTVVLMHLRQRVAIVVELARSLLPPDREVFLEGATHVRTVGGRLRNDLVERLAGSLPVLSLDSKERCESECSWQTQDPVLNLGAQDRSHQGVSETPTNCQVDEGLGAQFLELVRVELLHFDDLPFAQIVIL